jgi:hypothetical protein
VHLQNCEKAIISFVMSEGLSVPLHAGMEQLGSHWTECLENLYWNIFRKYVDKNPICIKIQQELWVFCMKADIHYFIIHRSVLLTKRNISVIFVTKIKIYSIFNNTFSPKHLPIYEKMWKNIVGPDKPLN